MMADPNIIDHAIFSSSSSSSSSIRGNYSSSNSVGSATATASATTMLPPAKRQKRAASQYGVYEDIEEMMYGFGDKWPPNPESVELMEKIAANYIRNVCQRAKDVADLTGTLDKECFMYAVRKDRRKFTRVYGLLKTNEELKRLQKTEFKQEENENNKE